RRYEYVGYNSQLSVCDKTGVIRSSSVSVTAGDPPENAFSTCVSPKLRREFSSSTLIFFAMYSHIRRGINCLMTVYPCCSNSSPILEAIKVSPNLRDESSDHHRRSQLVV